MLSSKKKIIAFIGIISIATSGIIIGVYFFQLSSNPTFKLGALSGDLHHLPLFVALENNYFEEEGLDIQNDDIIWFQNGNEAMIAFEAESLDISYLGLAPAMAHKLTRNAPIKIVSGVNVNGSAIMVRNNDLIQLSSDLEDKTIAVPSLNNMQDFILQIALNISGVSIKKVNRTVLSVANMESVLEKGDIDGFVAWEPFNAKSADGIAKYLNFSSEVWPNHPCCIIASSLDFISQKSGIVEKVVKIHKRSLEWMVNSSNHNALVNIAKKYTGIQKDSIIEAALNNIGYIYNFTAYQSQINQFYNKLVELNDNIGAWPLGREVFFDHFLETKFLNV